MLGAIGGAWAFQIFGDFAPCPLCLRQRVPYYLAIPMGLAALIFLPRLTGRIAAVVACAVMIWGVSQGVTHAGAEWGLWETTCPGGGEGVRDASNLLAALEEAEFVSCTAVQGRVLGLSFAGWNAVAASLSALLMAAAAFTPPRTRP